MSVSDGENRQSRNLTLLRAKEYLEYRLKKIFNILRALQMTYKLFSPLLPYVLMASLPRLGHTTHVQDTYYHFVCFIFGR